MEPHQWCILWQDGHVSIWPADQFTEQFLEELDTITQFFPVY